MKEQKSIISQNLNLLILLYEWNEYIVMSASNRSIRGLDWVSFFLANVRDGLGPYLAIYLLGKNWNPSDIGIAMALPGISRIMFQAPAGAFIDRTRFKRILVVISSLTIAACCIIDIAISKYQVIISSQIVIGIATSIYTPTIAAITLGIVGYNDLPKRIGKNESLNHMGNVCNAILAAVIAYFISYEAIFYLVCFCGIASTVAVLCIRERDIDHYKARAAKDEAEQLHTPARFQELLSNRNILLFAMAVTLFGLANGSMLSLAGQKLYIIDHSNAYTGMSACIIVAQAVMIFVARFTGKFVSDGNKKIIFLLCFAIVPLRGFLYTLSDESLYIIFLQVLDGISGGIFGVLSIVMIADLTEGTGRFNFVQGLMTALIGIGTALSSYITGFLVEGRNYTNSFLFLTYLGLFAFFFVWMFITSPKVKTA